MSDVVTKPGSETTTGRRLARRVLRTLVLWGAVFAVIALLASCVVFVDETQYVIVERLGTIAAVYDREEDRGLQFKLPWPISTVRTFDRRLQLLDPPGRELFTGDKKNITVDTYVCWRIAPTSAESSAELSDRPVVRFFRSLGNVSTAEDRLMSRLQSLLSAEFGRVELTDLLSVENSEAGPQGDSSMESLTERLKSRFEKSEEGATSPREALGIEIVDVRIKRINLPEANRFAVFERMKSERQKIADRYRSAGLAQNTVIRSQADRQREEILAKADADAQRIRGTGEAEALRILNQAHAQDPEFYRFERTLQSYHKILNERTTLVLSASSALLKLLTEGIPDIQEPQPETKPADPSTEPPVAEKNVSQSSATPDTISEKTRAEATK
ncbi:Modulator of FtsH protease HflC [Symmachiella dynata]|uniref:protease modulator HflC n=1 Tax=Symmachiella dynata TaxID=2527995 RepID=UPI00118ABE5A|nr:protease modulator HflC [Symmachiella dynata]QDT47167.1 Modulator of FtsH protease HflC [Symmachiella dynata]